MSSSLPEPGAIIAGKFRVLRLIGQGGMGAVLEAENTLTGKRVAVKWMQPLGASSQPAERFLREAQAASRVRHPNVVDVYDFVREGDAFFLVMELLEGEPLTAVLERGGMPLYELVSLLLDAMRGVAAAHAQGVVHRDIKPDNIFLERQPDRPSCVPKVIDFGVSKLSDMEGLSLTRSGATLGTPLYMSYEQLRGAKDVDVRTDVYSFGVILYEAMTGQPPFQADTLTELVVKVTTTEPLRAKTVRPDLPTSLDNLIHWAMAIDREQRLPNMGALIRELEPYASEHGFRGQMTLDGASMPKVAMGAIGGSLRPATPPPDLVPLPRAIAPQVFMAPRQPATAPGVRAARRMWWAAAVIAVLSLVGLGLAMRSSLTAHPEATRVAEPSAGPAEPSSAAVPRPKLTATPVAQAAAPPAAPAPAQPPVETEPPATAARPAAGAPPPRTAQPAAPDEHKESKKRSRKPAAHAESGAPSPSAAPEPKSEGKFRAGRPLREDF